MFSKLNRILFISILLLITGCTTYQPYRYSFSLIDPDVEDLTYEDEDIFFQFIPAAEHIWVSVYNMSEDSINFIRNEAEYIDPNGESHNILFGWNFASAMKDFLRDGLYSNSIKIDPKSASEGNVWINIWPGPGGDIGEGWVTVSDSEIEYLDHGMLPEYEFQGDGMMLKESTFSLVLPIEFSGYMKGYQFTFMITDVEVIDRK
ncbi:MAG: hypothetical protein MAG551_02277 [Candidatus Scalindua arabica]|uniref:Uncharacterized protein n=1 Tax=Candidatus Scalindua arabica TaxID=1127984 RepID=A0A941W768_9BACT|nr:hypothetical protein [Candidatus Scalindua arabica]